MLQNLVSKKFATLVGVVTLITQMEGEPLYKLGAVVVVTVGYFLGDAWQNRVVKVAQGVQAGAELGK